MSRLVNTASALTGNEFKSVSRSSGRNLVLFLSAVMLLKLLFSAVVDLTPDEAYYWNWSNYLDLSYYDHPPMVAYIISVTTLFGYADSAVMVRIGALLMSIGISVIVYRMAASIFGDPEAGFWAAVWLNLSLLFSLGASIITPDTPQALFSMLFIYFFYRALFESLRHGFYIAGIFLGLALLSKYTAFLLMPSTLLFLLLSREHRYLLFRKELYLMFLLSMIIFSPVLIWNHQHNWSSFQFQFAHGLSSKSIHNPILGFLELLGTQLLLITPFLFLLLSLSAFYCGRAGLVKREPVFLFLFCMSVPLLLFFFLVSLKTRVEGNWPSLGYLALIVASGGFTTGFKGFFCSEKIRRRIAVLKRISVVSASLIVLSVHLLTLNPPLFILKKTSLTSRIIGWKDLGEKVTGVMEGKPKSLFVLANSHQVSSEINFYSDGSYKAYQMGEHYRYPYLKSHLDALQGSDAIYLTEVGEEDNGIDHVKKFFDSVTELEPLGIDVRGERVKLYKVYRCFNYKGGYI